MFVSKNKNKNREVTFWQEKERKKENVIQKANYESASRSTHLLTANLAFHRFRSIKTISYLSVIVNNMAEISIVYIHSHENNLRSRTLSLP